MYNKFPNIRDIPDGLEYGLEGILSEIKECLELMLSRRSLYLPVEARDPVNLSHITLPIEIEGTGMKIYGGEGTPEGNQIANIGSVYLRSDGSTSTSMYIKESGLEAVGWVAK